MRSQIQSASRPPSPWNIPVLNTSGDTIPPHGVMEIVNASEVGEDTIYLVDKPGISGSRVFLINSPAEIPQEGAGWGTDSYPTEVAFNAFSGIPGAGTQWDVVVGSFLLAIPIPPILPTGAKYNILGGAHIAVGEPSLVRAFPATAAQAPSTDRFVAADEPDQNPKTLIEKLWHAVAPLGFAPPYDDTVHQLVFAQNRGAVGNENERKVALYTNKVTAAPPALGVFICTLYDTIQAGSTGSRGVGGGTVYSCGPGGGNAALGDRTIYNPFGIPLPSSGIYTCLKTFAHATNPTSDEFTITGIDPLHLLASLDGFGEKKALAVGEGQANVSTIKWLGEECEESSG
jgi:hypothetical protein